MTHNSTRLKFQGYPLVPNHMLSSGKLYSNKTDVNYVDLRVTSPSLAAGYKIVNADFTNDVHPANFSKYDHLVVPPLNVKVVEEFTTDNWGRLPMVGTPSRLQEITRQLTQVAEDAGMPADQAFSFNHISHRFMTVKNETVNGRPKDYELWNLVLNKDFLTGFSTEVTLEGPFLPCNGPEPGTQVKLPFHNHEMILRMETSDSLKTEKAVSEITELPLLIYPNPARDSFHVRFNLSASSPVKLIVFNSLGVNLYEEETDLAPGWHTTSVDLSNVSHSGVCFVSVTTAQGARMGKVLVE